MERKSRPASRSERALVSAWMWGHITRADLARKVGEERAAELVRPMGPGGAP